MSSWSWNAILAMRQIRASQFGLVSMTMDSYDRIPIGIPTRKIPSGQPPVRLQTSVGKDGLTPLEIPTGFVHFLRYGYRLLSNAKAGFLRVRFSRQVPITGSER